MGETVKVVLTRTLTRLVAAVAAVVDDVAHLVLGDAAAVAALELALPTGKHRRRHENADENRPVRV